MYIVRDTPGTFYLYTDNGSAIIESPTQLLTLRKFIKSNVDDPANMTASELAIVNTKIAEARGQQPVTIEVSAEAIATSLKPKLNIPTAAECGAAARFAIIKP
jgi:hypothetical protein